MNSKRFVIITLKSTCILLILIGSVTAIVDPFFHYHKPLKFLNYVLDNERYQNDGIVKHFDYDAVITGTSMTENFKTSEFDRVFSANSIKVPFSGERYKEIDLNIKRAFAANNNIKYVLRCLDYSGLIVEKDVINQGCPRYLYDKNPFNDIEYLLNKEILLNETIKVLVNTKNAVPSTTFDEYANWNFGKEYGRKAVLKTYNRPELIDGEIKLSDEEIEIIQQNLRQNIIETVKENPKTKFLIYFSPYSICWWDSNQRAGKLGYYIEAEKVAIEELLRYDNIYLYSFTNNYDLICNLDYYKDQAHYGEEVNSKILYWIKEQKYRLTNENYKQYLTDISNFYYNYNYDKIFEDLD